MEAVSKVTLAWILIVAVTITSPPTGAAGSDPAAPSFSGSYLSVWTRYDRYETFDRISVEIQSFVVVPGTNDTEPNTNPVFVSLYAEDMDLVVYQETVHLFLGNFTVYATVEPEWTSSHIQIVARDPSAGLENDTVRIETVMSSEYWVYLTKTAEYEDDQRDAQALRDRLDLLTILGSLVVGFLGTALFVIFLRVDHHRSRKVRSPSIWDRFVNRVWPYSWTNDEAYFMLEDPNTWAPDTAAQFADFKKVAHLRKLRAQVRSIEDEARAIQEGRIHV